VPGQPFSLANLREAANALYGKRQWQGLLARDLGIPPQTIKRWFAGKPLPDLRKPLADLCRRNAADNPKMLELAHKIEEFGTPER
jgi:hypothetical protein